MFSNIDQPGSFPQPTFEYLSANLQRIINETNAAIRVNNASTQHVGESVLESSAIFIKGNEPDDEIAEQPIFLASVSKTAIVDFFFNEIKETGHTSFDVPVGLILELLARDQGKRIFEISQEATHPMSAFYKQIVEKLSEEETNFLITDLSRVTTEDKEKLKEGIKEKIQLLFPDGIVKDFSAKEIMFYALNPSTNNSLGFIKTFLEQKYTPEQLYTLLSEKIPDFGMFVGDPGINFHWVQPDANTGLLSSFAQYFHSFVQDSTRSELVEMMTNNSYDFGFDFTHSDLGKELIDKGWEIVEKTGVYEDGVNWVQTLASRGLPIHIPILSIFTLEPPGTYATRQPITFAYYEALRLELPDWQNDDYKPYVEDIEVDGKTVHLEFINVYTKTFGDNANKVFSLRKLAFRENMARLVQSQIGQV